jgi:uncharacterized phage protein (TIGR02220 family)
MAKIPEGCILLARKIQKSDIWKNKPSWWLKVWVYILLNVNHKDNQMFKRGQNFFNTDQIYYDCKLQLEGIKPVTIRNVTEWLRDTEHIQTKNTLRGVIITVCKYEEYQNILNYKKASKTQPKTQQETHQKHSENTPINNNDINDMNDYKEYIHEVFSYFLLKTGKKYKLTDDRRYIIKQRLKEGYTVNQMKQATDNFVLDDWEGRQGFIDVIYCLGKQRGKSDNLEKWLDYKPKPKPTFTSP